MHNAAKVVRINVHNNEAKYKNIMYITEIKHRATSMG